MLQDSTRALPKGAPAPAEIPAGVPRPPPEGESPGPLRRGFLYSHGAEGVRGSSFRPDGHSVVINGRPVQAPAPVGLRAPSVHAFAPFFRLCGQGLRFAFRWEQCAEPRPL